MVGGGGLLEYIFGGPGDDTLRGGREVDLLDGGPGADLMSGGSSGFEHANLFQRHIDTVSYEGRTGNVDADLDGIADDGEAWEGDRILGDVESIEGGHGNDVLTGSQRSNYLVGGAGDDLLRGLRGHDQLEGGTGEDRLHGGVGIDGLRGNAGNDIVIGGLGADRMAGGAGVDVLRARDGVADRVRGGPGRDSGQVDPAVDDMRGVERIVRRAF